MDLKSRFKQLGMKQEDVARTLGMTQSRVAQILNNSIPPTKNQEAQILRLLLSLIEGKRKWPDDFIVTRGGINDGVSHKRSEYKSTSKV